MNNDPGRVKDFPLTDRLKALLDQPDCAQWMLANVRYGAAPTFDEQGRLCFRFEDDDEAERFRARWLDS